MAKTKFSDEELKRLREVPLLKALDALELHYQHDPGYKPRKSQESMRVIVSVNDLVYTLQITGMRLYDMYSKEGGGGAIDLTMHLMQCEFLEAAKLLQKSLRLRETERQKSELLREEACRLLRTLSM